MILAATLVPLEGLDISIQPIWRKLSTIFMREAR